MENKEKSKAFNEIISWLEKQNGKYTDVSDAELAKFAGELNTKIGVIKHAGTVLLCCANKLKPNIESSFLEEKIALSV